MGIDVNILLKNRKQWYLENEYLEFNGNLPPFIQLKLDTELRRDLDVFNWLSNQNSNNNL